MEHSKQQAKKTRMWRQNCSGVDRTWNKWGWSRTRSLTRWPCLGRWRDTKNRCWGESGWTPHTPYLQLCVSTTKMYDSVPGFGESWDSAETDICSVSEVTRQHGGRQTWQANSPSTTWRKRPCSMEETMLWDKGKEGLFCFSVLNIWSITLWGVIIHYYTVYPMNTESHCSFDNHIIVFLLQSGRIRKREWPRRPVTSQRAWWAWAGRCRSRCSKARRRWPRWVGGAP